MHLVQFLEGCQQNVYSGGPTPSDKGGGGGHPDPEIRGGGGLQKIFFETGGGDTSLCWIRHWFNCQPPVTVASTDHKQGRIYEYLILLKIMSQFLLLMDYLLTYLILLIYLF